MSDDTPRAQDQHPEHDPNRRSNPWATPPDNAGSAPFRGAPPTWQPQPTPYILADRPDRRGMWIPAIISGVVFLAFIVGFLSFAFGTSSSDVAFSRLFGVGLCAVPIAGVTMCFPENTRRWGQGTLLGIPLAIGGALVVGAGLCVALLASNP